MCCARIARLSLHKKGGNVIVLYYKNKRQKELRQVNKVQFTQDKVLIHVWTMSCMERIILLPKKDFIMCVDNDRTLTKKTIRIYE